MSSGIFDSTTVLLEQIETEKRSAILKKDRYSGSNGLIKQARLEFNVSFGFKLTFFPSKSRGCTSGTLLVGSCGATPHGLGTDEQHRPSE